MEYPLLVLNQVCGQFKELDEVVEDTEENNGDDVAEATAHVALGEGEADGDEPLEGDGHHAVDAPRQGDVDDGEGVGRDVGVYPHVELF